MFKFFLTVFLASALLSFSLVSADVNAVGGFISHAGCDADTFLFVTSIQVSPAPDFFLTITPTLSGLCPNAAGKMVNSTLNLNKCLENSNANLVVSGLFLSSFISYSYANSLICSGRESKYLETDIYCSVPAEL
jgi:hypothetical protein